MLPHPRSRSRQSTSSTLPDVDSLQSWFRPMINRHSGGGSGSTATTSTSIFSDGDDGATVLPSSEEGPWSTGKHKIYGDRGYEGGRRRNINPSNEKPLIELDSDYESQPPRPPPVSKTTKPSEELRRLLRQMEDEVKSSTPLDPFSAAASPTKREKELPRSPFEASSRIPRSPPAGNQRRANWREGRRIGVYPPPGVDSSPERGVEHEREGNEDGEEEDSPPTPPPRITNPYLYSGRKTSDPIVHTKHRISSRAAVLQNSTSQSPPHQSTSPSHSPSPLEAFIATQPLAQEPSSSRSPQSFRSSTSRKGKERADPNLLQQNHHSRHSPSSSEDLHQSHRTLHRPTPAQARPRRTPRRVSVELAPDDSEVFAQDLERREEIELDLDEEAEDGLGRPWASETGSEEADRTERVEDVNTSPYQSREDSGRLSRLLHVKDYRREESVDVSLPHLPDLGDEDGDEGDEERELERRRAGLFRSGSRNSVSPRPDRMDIEGQRTSPNLSQRSPGSPVSRSSSTYQTADTSYNRPIPVKSASPLRAESSYHQDTSHLFPAPPIRIGMTLTPPSAPAISTPSNPTLQTGETTNLATPHPPGFYARTPAQAGRAVRFSPLRKTDQDWSLSGTTSSIGDSVSVHRLKLSPAKRTNLSSPLKPLISSPLSKGSPGETETQDPDTSFTARITRFLLPKPSTTLLDASADLERARRLSEIAQVRVEESRLAWSEALGRLGLQAGEVGKKGVRWGWWSWWVCLEVVLIWCVFRVTLDYTSSLNPHSNTFQTINLNPHALSTRIPGAISAFVIPRESANFFDLLERYEVWKRVEGVMSRVVNQDDGAGVGSRIRMVGGVPS